MGRRRAHLCIPIFAGESGDFEAGGLCFFFVLSGLLWSFTHIPTGSTACTLQLARYACLFPFRSSPPDKPSQALYLRPCAASLRCWCCSRGVLESPLMRRRARKISQGLEKRGRKGGSAGVSASYGTCGGSQLGKAPGVRERAEQLRVGICV